MQVEKYNSAYLECGKYVINASHDCHHCFT